MGKENLFENQTERVLHEDGAMTLSEIMGLFESDQLLRENSQKVYKIDTFDGRFHFTFDRTSFEPTFYISVSDFIAKTTPTPWHILKWYAEKGMQEADRIKRESGDYGTLMHILFSELLISWSLDLDSIHERVGDYFEAYNLDYDRFSWSENLKRDCLSFAQWIKDYEVEPVAVEIMLVDPDLGISGAVDLVCEMNAQKYTEKTPKDQRKRVRALVDNKSGRKGFYENNQIQVHAYKHLWEANFPDLLIDKVYNWSPKAWKKAPSYNFADQTESSAAEKLPLLIELAQIDSISPNTTFKFTRGQIDLKDDLQENYSSVELDEIIKKRLA